MKKYLPVLIAVLVVLGAALACLQTAPPTPSVDKGSTAAALSATEQALNFKATEQALKATQGAIGSAPAAESQPSDQSNTVRFYLKNNSDFTVCYVLFSPASLEDYREEDVLPVKIDPATSQTFNVEPGIYNLVAADCTGDVYVEELHVEVPRITRWELTRMSQGGGNNSNPGLCGNGACDSGENAANCPFDCLSAECGNGYCESGEDAVSCGWDCAFCPDGYCTGYENGGNCPQDCGSQAECGNGYCEAGEDARSCGWDCAFCPDGFCTGYENGGNCPQDCGSQAECGNGYCESGEDALSCGYDCAFCPDGYCTGFENGGNCPQDCK